MSKSTSQLPRFQIEPFDPSNPYTDISKMWESCYDETKPCDLLLDHPALFFARKHPPQRSDHLCGLVSETSIRRWITRRDPQLANMLLKAAFPLGILPVGRESIADDVLYLQEKEALPAGFDPRVMDNLALFDGKARASLIVDHELYGLRVELYFLVEIHHGLHMFTAMQEAGGSPWGAFYPSELRFRISGSGRKSNLAEASKMVEEAAEWWEVAIAGFPIHPNRGRPAGSLEWPLGKIEKLRTECRAETGHDSYTQEQFFEWLAVLHERTSRKVPSRNTVLDRVQDTGLGWRGWWSQQTT